MRNGHVRLFSLIRQPLLAFAPCFPPTEHRRTPRETHAIDPHRREPLYSSSWWKKTLKFLVRRPMRRRLIILALALGATLPALPLAEAKVVGRLILPPTGRYCDATIDLEARWQAIEQCAELLRFATPGARGAVEFEWKVDRYGRPSAVWIIQADKALGTVLVCLKRAVLRGRYHRDCRGRKARYGLTFL